MRITKDDGDKAAARLMRGELSHADELCLRETVACYDSREAIDETIYSNACAILKAAFPAPFIPDEHGKPIQNPAFLGVPSQGASS